MNFQGSITVPYYNQGLSQCPCHDLGYLKNWQQYWKLPEVFFFFLFLRTGLQPSTIFIFQEWLWGLVSTDYATGWGHGVLGTSQLPLIDANRKLYRDATRYTLPSVLIMILIEYVSSSHFQLLVTTKINFLHNDFIPKLFFSRFAKVLVHWHCNWVHPFHFWLSSSFSFYLSLH